MKFDVAPPLTPLLSLANAAFDEAEIVVVVGFSFADADLYISRMVSRAMQKSSKQKLVIADPDGTVVGRLRRKFMASIPNFTPSRIIRMTGDCADTLPKLLNGDYLKRGEPDKAVRRAHVKSQAKNRGRSRKSKA